MPRSWLVLNVLLGCLAFVHSLGAVKKIAQSNIPRNGTWMLIGGTDDSVNRDGKQIWMSEDRLYVVKPDYRYEDAFDIEFDVAVPSNYRSESAWVIQEVIENFFKLVLVTKSSGITNFK